MKTLKIVLTLLAIMLAVVLTGCGSDNKSANTGNQGLTKNKLTEIKLGYQKGMPLLSVMKEQGLLEKRLKEQGISVTWHEFPSTPALIEGMGTGGIVFGGGAGTGSIFAQAGERPFVRVAAQTGVINGSSILVQENSPIKAVADLKGKKVAVAKGTLQLYLLVRALEQAGLKFSDIEPLYLNPAEALPAFERGDFAAWVIWDPYTAEAERQLHARVLADNGTVFGDKAGVEGALYYYASPELVRDNPEVLKIILQELEKAGSWSNANYKDSAALLANLYKADLATLEIVEQRGGNRQILLMTDEVTSALQRMTDVFYDLKIIPKKVDVKDKNYNWVPDQKW